MKDTSPKTESLVHEMTRQRPGSERLAMGCSMFDMSKRIVEDSIRAKTPGIGEGELKVQVFLRFYRRDFSEQQRNRIISRLRKNHP